MRVFRAINRSQTGQWIVAPDEDTARQLSLKLGHARKLANVTVRDVTAECLATNAVGLPDILAQGKTGVLARQIPSWTVDEVMRQALGEQIVKPEPTWIFREFPL